MGIRLPNLGSTKCQLLVACGELEPQKNSSILRLLEKPERKIAYYRPGSGGRICAKALAGGPKRHFHVDFATSAFLKEVGRPAKTATIGELRKFIDQFLGLKIAVHVTGTFLVPIAELPEQGIIRATLGTHGRAGTLVLRVVGARVAIEGAPADEIEWLLVGDRSTASVTIEATRAETIDEEYLNRLLGAVELAFQVFILGAKDARKPDRAVLPD